MILVDTSVWVEHLRHGHRALAARLEGGEVLCHPFVHGELACGRMARRQEVLALLADLPSIPVAEDDEVLELIESRALMGQGLGWVDCHLIASALIAGVGLWTIDRRLASTANRLGLSGGKA